MKNDVQTVTLWNFLIVNENMPDDMAAWLTKTALDNQKVLLGVTKSAKFMTAENSLKYGHGILHPAAEALFLKDIPQEEAATESDDHGDD
jgi:TRAP-type uncharacterized transport system substrate-binding protein